MLDLSFVILTWNSRRYLDRCFDSIIQKCKKEDISFEIIVIDNGSSDGSAEVFGRYNKQIFGNFRTFFLNTNKGTTLPRNLGLKAAMGRNVCICDSDTEFSTGSLTDILARLDSDPSMGIIAPRLLLPDGSVQPSVKRFPTFWHKLLKIPKAIWGLPMPDGDFYEDFPFSEEKAVDSAISACWFFRADMVKDVGYLDEKIFYSPEDLDYSARVWKAGRSILYYPALTVLHHTQQISHKKPFSKTSLSHFGGLLYYYRKHGGWVSCRSLYKAALKASAPRAGEMG